LLRSYRPRFSTVHIGKLQPRHAAADQTTTSLKCSR
jgi:hypothetical protein